MIYDLVDCNDPILREELAQFDFANPPTDPIQLAHDLAETMIHNEGLGLAANQMGLPYRVFAIRAQQIIVCFNPRIVDVSEEQIYLEEGCLSFPDLYIKIKRPAEIRVRYTEPNGNTVTKQFKGITARVFQHELDHLNGIVHTSRANRYHLEIARKRAKKPKNVNISSQARSALTHLELNI